LSESLLRFIAASSGTGPAHCLDLFKSEPSAEHRQWFEMPHEAYQPCGRGRFAALNIALILRRLEEVSLRLRSRSSPVSS